MKIVIAPDSFKGSLSSKKVCDIIEKAANKVFENAEIVKIPIADGGEGTIDAINQACNAKIINARVSGSLENTKVNAKYCVISNTAVIEMAQANGLTVIENKDPLNANTYGTGELILHALNKGYKNIVVAIGGSATNDGGCGAMQALGFEFYDANNALIKRVCGKNLADIARIDDKNACVLAKKATFTVMCDVNNQLTGDKGATYTFGRQKGADTKMLGFIEEGMLVYEKALNEYAGYNVGKVSGTGAAGGLGGALKGMLNAQMQPGILAVLKLVDFDAKIKNADLIVTGEGNVDFQSSYGKVLWGIAQKSKGIPVIAFAGGIGEGSEKLREIGINAIVSIVNKPMSLKDAMEQSEKLLYESAYNIFEIAKI